MEERKANMIVSATGGNASKHSLTYKMSIPTSWATDMKITKEDRAVKMTYTNKRIIIERIPDHLTYELSKDNMTKEAATGYVLFNKLVAFADQEIIMAQAALDFAEDIFNTNESGGEGDEVINELLNNGFQYFSTSYTDHVGYDPEFLNYTEAALVLKQVNDYLSWADEMKSCLSR